MEDFNKDENQETAKEEDFNKDENQETAKEHRPRQKLFSCIPGKMFSKIKSQM